MMPIETRMVAGFLPDPAIDWPAAYAPASAQVFTQNSIDIAAEPETVWSALIDCTAWPRWYPLCSDVSMLRGGPRLGPDSTFRFKMSGHYFAPDIVTFEPSRLLVWSAKGPVGTGGAHAWHIAPTPGGCRVVTEEVQKGLILRLIGGGVRKTMLTANQAWLSGLKDVAERG